jgi:anti-anti-sigma factor
MEVCLPDRMVAPADDLEITTAPQGPGMVIHLAGRISIDSAPGLRDRLLAHFREEKRSVTVDMSEVSYLDCAGIATLIEALKMARNRLITFRIEGLNGNLENLFQATGLLALFETYGANSSSASRVS